MYKWDITFEQIVEIQNEPIGLVVKKECSERFERASSKTLHPCRNFKSNEFEMIN